MAKKVPGKEPKSPKRTTRPGDRQRKFQRIKTATKLMPDGRRSAYTFRTEEKENELCGYLEQGYTVAGAADACNISRQNVYDWRNKDPEFEKRVMVSMAVGTDYLEQILTQRAAHGTFKKIFHDGVCVDSDVVHHDVLAMFLMKARNRARFGDHGPDEGGGNAGAVDVQGGLPEEPGT